MVGALTAAATVWFLQVTAQVLWLFAGGLLIAYMLDPALDRLEKRGWSRLRAVSVVSACVVLGLVLVASWAIPSLVVQVQNLARNWPSYSQTIDTQYQKLDGLVRAYAEERFPELDIAPFMDEKVEEAQQWLAKRLPLFVGFITDWLVRSFSLVGLFAVLAIISFHFMLIIDPFRHTVRKMLPQAARQDVSGISREVGQMLGQYVRGQVMMMMAAGGLATCAMLVVRLAFGTQYSLVIGLITGLTYVIPWVGAVASGATAAVFGYVSATHDPVLASAAAVGAMIAVNQVCDQLVMPRVIGRRVGLHPLAVIFAILAGYQIMGFAGMIIAAPAAASVKIIMARWLPLKRVAVKPGRPEPLVFDLGEAVRMAAAGIHGLTRRIEDAMGMAPQDDEPDTTNQEDTEDGGQTNDDAATAG